MKSDRQFSAHWLLLCWLCEGFWKGELTIEKCDLESIEKINGCIVFVFIWGVYLPAVFQVKYYAVDDVISIQETLDIFKHFLPDKDKHMQTYNY